MAFYIHVQETPNPGALKFISQYTVKTSGKSNYRNPEEAAANPLAVKLFALPGVMQIFFFDNYVTVTKADPIDWDPLADQIHDLLQKELPEHDPNYEDSEAEKVVDRASLPPEVREVEEVLDRTVRPYLAADGGGIEVIERKGNTVLIRYQGACGSCPSSFGGTLMAIQSALQQELDPDIEVIDASGGWY